MLANSYTSYSYWPRRIHTKRLYIYIYIQIYYDASLLLERPGSPSAGAQPARASCNFFFPSSSSCVSADVVVMGTREKPIDVWGKKEDGGGGRSGKNGARLL